MEADAGSGSDADTVPDAAPDNEGRGGREDRLAAGTGTPANEPRAGGRAPPEPAGTVTACQPGAAGGGTWIDWPVFDRGALHAGDRLAGPAIVAEPESTTLLPAGDTARVSGEGNLVIEVSAKEPRERRERSA